MTTSTNDPTDHNDKGSAQGAATAGLGVTPEPGASTSPMSNAEFLRRYVTRAPGLMWFLGAGTSAAAGVPTATDMVWDFKRFLYRTEQRVSPAEVADLANPAVPAQIQRYLDSTGRHPPSGSADEYGHYFEEAYPDESDRRSYIAAKTTGARPSYGQLAIATLLRAEKARVLWSTNFDGLIEDACAQVYETTTALTVATPDAADIALQALQEERWPILVKLHGDFRSRALKNTSDEVRVQDAKLRRAFVDSCRRWGLVMVGFSGRDNSIMEALEEGCTAEGYPSGLFWLHYGDAPLHSRVVQLLLTARAAGIDAALIEIGSFDELAGDVVRQFEDLSDVLRTRLDAKRQRVTDSPMPPPGRGWPVIRTNALEILEWPTVVRRVQCSVGGIRELREAITGVSADILATRTKLGVLAFGSDEQVRRALGDFTIDTFDLHPIERHRLYRETHERELIYDALARALCRDRPLRVAMRRSERFLVPIMPIPAEALTKLTAVTGAVTGQLPQSGLTWFEALGLKLDFALSRLWLVIEPRIWFDPRPDRSSKAEAADFARERFARRYNRDWNRLLDAWIALLLEGRVTEVLRAFSISDGVDATFRLTAVTAFSNPEVTA